MKTTLLSLIISLMLVLPQHSFAGDVSESEKIEMLLEKISQANATFIRNGKKHSVNEASDHIRKKLAYAGDRIKTARQFVDMLASRSYFSKKPYYIQFDDGDMKTTRYWLLLQLHRFEESYDSASLTSANSTQS